MQWVKSNRNYKNSIKIQLKPLLRPRSRQGRYWTALNVCDNTLDKTQRQDTKQWQGMKCEPVGKTHHSTWYGVRMKYNREKIKKCAHKAQQF
jgi:hypothetical protein